MTTIYVDSSYPDEERRHLLYDGDIFVLSPSAQSLALVDWARELLEQAFAPHPPTTAQHAMDVHRFVDIFGPVKPRFIYHPRTRQLLQELLAAVRCDVDDVYLDVPRLRGVTSDRYLTAGVGYAHPMHRDTWWSAPLGQLNWWLPVYEFASGSSMAFHPEYWGKGVANGSAEFNYYEWNRVGRAQAAKHVTADMRKQPKIEEPVESEPQVRIVVPRGGIVLFSGAQMHSTVANETGVTRFSIDFRTVSLADLRAERAAPNLDSAPSGTSLRDFRRAADGTELPDDVVARYDSGPLDPDSAVFRPRWGDAGLSSPSRVG